MRFSRRRILIAALGMLPLALLFVAWRASSWRPVIRRVSKSPILSLKFSSDGAQLECVSVDQIWRSLDVPFLSVAASQNLEFFDSVPSFSENGNRLVLRNESTLDVWDTVARRELGHVAVSRPLQEVWGQPTLSKQGDVVAVSNITPRGQTLWRLSVKAGHVTAQRLGAVPVVSALPYVFSSNLSLVASCSDLMTIQMTNTRTSKVLWQFSSDTPNALCFSTDNRVLAVAEQSTVLLMDAHTGNISKSINLSTGSVQRIIYSPDGRLLALALLLLIRE